MKEAQDKVRPAISAYEEVGKAETKADVDQKFSDALAKTVPATPAPPKTPETGSILEGKKPTQKSALESNLNDSIRDLANAKDKATKQNKSI